MDAELKQELVDISRRLARGASKGGRYNKHDTARLRFIRDKALMGIRLGILVPDSDLSMLRLEPQEQLRQRGGADWAAMETWAERHGKDPRSKRSDGSLDETQQMTLLRWVARNTARFYEPVGVRRGAPAEYTLDFGAYSGYSIRTLIRHANSASARAHLLPNPSSGTPKPGPYIVWLASTAFQWQFPRHLKLFFALRGLDFAGCRVCDGDHWRYCTIYTIILIDKTIAPEHVVSSEYSTYLYKYMSHPPTHIDFVKRGPTTTCLGLLAYCCATASHMVAIVSVSRSVLKCAGCSGVRVARQAPIVRDSRSVSISSLTSGHDTCIVRTSREQRSTETSMPSER